MLTKWDLRWVYRWTRFCSKLNLLPVTFDPVTGQIRRQRTVWRNVMFHVWILLGLAHNFFMVARTVHVIILSESDTYRDFIPMIVIICHGFLTCTTILYLPVVTGAEENFIVFNEILRIRGKSYKKNNKIWIHMDGPCHKHIDENSRHVFYRV